MRQWHDLSEEELDFLTRPRTEAELNQVLASVFGPELEPALQNAQLWKEIAKRDGLCWWGFDVREPQSGAEFTINVFFWNLHTRLLPDAREALGRKGIEDLERRLDVLAAEWGIEREWDEDAFAASSEDLAAVTVVPPPRRRPSGLTRLVEA